MTFCNGATKATITVSLGGQVVEKIISNAPGVNVTLQHGQSAQIQGEGLNSATCGGLGNFAVREYDGFVELIGFTYQDPNTSNQCPALKFLVNGIWVNPTIDILYPGNASIVRQYSSDWVLSVTDAIGRVVTRKYSTKPTYTVTCDDDCPEGFHKCIHNKYPGYCCIPCKETGDRLKNMANKVGQ
ncbi:MAG: hypothetical protein RMY16_26260 [Nostoc sp. DedQUE12b]|uniref:hypothetical protein n=1 Tax=Nostoc sp. DedQUE12b TaxID=3075398 RepID=UPI002AD4942E|nr:hypothetical protein [Nostoc sp. DedQUE12b]MDZ8089024.1 hypothetical protein [Nostoc sp. DedQUE12b]